MKNKRQIDVASDSIRFRCAPSWKAKVNKKAKEDERTLSAFIIRATNYYINFKNENI